MNTYNESIDGGALVAWMEANAAWNGFAASLVAQHRRGKRWSERQIAAADRMREKCEATRARKAKLQQDVDVSGVEALFAASKLRSPKFYFGDLAMSKAGPRSRNAGAYYVKICGEYVGKIANGRYMPTAAATDDAVKRIVEVSNGVKLDGVAYLMQVGHATTRCACCGRELTDPASVERGIGPICADNIGL